MSAYFDQNLHNNINIITRCSLKSLRGHIDVYTLTSSGGMVIMHLRDISHAQKFSESSFFELHVRRYRVLKLQSHHENTTALPNKHLFTLELQ